MYRLFSDSSYVNGDIAVENRAEKGVLHVVSEELQAKGDGTDGAKGSISLKSDGSLQTDAKLAAEDNVNLTSVSGDVSINDNIYTGRASTNALVIRAGGAVTEAAGTVIATPVVETYSGKGVSLESEYNQFAAFRADALDTGAAIDGSVKAVTHYAGADQYTAKFENIVIGLYGEVDSGRDVQLTGRNGDLYVTDKINAKRDLDAVVNSDGGLFFEKDAVVTGDGVLAGNYIYARSITADNGGKVFHLSTMGPDNTKLIGDEIYIGSVRSKGGTETPSLWTNRGYLHVDEGNLDVKDVLAVDKLHLENEQTTLAVYGRTPTKDGEQLVYWNNVGMADSKTRGFQLFTDGKVRTRKAVLVDSYRNYSKLLGDNLSVVDMMRDHVTHERGGYTFDSKTLTEPGRLLREPMFFGVESTDVMIQQQNAPDAEIVIESF